MMFQNWEFLLTEIWGLIVVAALVGLVAGWLLFGGRKAKAAVGSFKDEQALTAAKAETSNLRKSLEAKTKEIEGLTAELDDLKLLAASALPGVAIGLGKDDDTPADPELQADMAEAGAVDPFALDDDNWVHGNLPEGLRHVLEKKDEQIAHLQSDLDDLRAELETDASAIEAKFEELLADAQSKDEEIDRLRAIVTHYTGE